MKPLRILSWGGGVQSTALAVLSALGKLPQLDAVVLADVGWERQRTYEIVAFYKRWLEARGIPVYVIPTMDIRKYGATEHIHMPFWVSSGGLLQRQCSREFKVHPLRRFIRTELLHLHSSKPPNPQPGSVKQWIGFSWDEWTRARPSGVQYINNYYPLLDLRMSRNDVIDMFETYGLPVPVKSACVGCPYRKASEYLKMIQDEPETFADACAFDEGIRHNPLAERGASTAAELYVYKQITPLRDADLERDARHERAAKQMPLFILTRRDSGGRG